MKIKISKKKFYNKYDYKVTLRIEGCETLRYHSIEESREFLENNMLPKFYLSDSRKLKVLANKGTLIRLCQSMSKYDSAIWQKRIERDSIDIYTNESDIVEELKTGFAEIITAIFEPADQPAEPFTLKVKKLPNDIYNYRVFLLPHKLKGDMEEKERFVSWIKSQRQKIKMTPAAEKWFYKTDWNWDPRYVLVDEESTLLMLKLRNSELVGRIYRFITD